MKKNIKEIRDTAELKEFELKEMTFEISANQTSARYNSQEDLIKFQN